MRILAVSDQVVADLSGPAIKQQFGDVALVLACGDLPLNYLESIVTRLNVPLLYVLGNHDQGIYTPGGQFKELPAGCTNVDERVVLVKGLLVGGLEGSMRYNEEKHQFTEWDMRRKAWHMLPALWANRLRYGRFLDILITHAPPYGVHDGEDLPHVGFRTFCWLMRHARPRYLIHGHQHIYQPETEVRTTYRHTEVVNAYGCQVVDWPPAVPLREG